LNRFKYSHPKNSYLKKILCSIFPVVVEIQFLISI
jgi:hypothetical protein